MLPVQTNLNYSGPYVQVGSIRIQLSMIKNENNTAFRDSIVVSIPACHAGDPGSIPGRGILN